MKTKLTRILAPLALGLTSLSAFAATDTAEMDYVCQVGKQEFRGSLELREDQLMSDPGAIHIGRKKTIVFVLERRYQTNEIYVTLKDLNDIRDPETFLFTGNISRQLSYVDTRFDRVIPYGVFGSKQAKMQCTLNARVTN